METLGKYELLEKLGDGISGSIYKARDKSLDRLVMLVTLGAEIRWDSASQGMFQDECRLLASLRHPNLAAFYEQGEYRKIVYIVTELLSGTNLKRLIAEMPAMTLERKLAIMIQAAAGLHHAHTCGLIHRNLQPSYVSILPDENVKVAGFGFILNSVPARTLTRGQESARIYLSPEQLAGDPATRQSDIYSIGLILYEFLTGSHPFHDADNARIVDRILKEQNIATVEHYPDLPMSLWPIVERCLAKLPGERYESMMNFGAACQAVLEELAEDAECMRLELHAALPRLRKATHKWGGPRALTDLQREMEDALLEGKDPDYQSLNRLVLALAEQHRLLDRSSEASFPTSTGFAAPAPETGMAVDFGKADSLKSPAASMSSSAENWSQDSSAAPSTESQQKAGPNSIPEKLGDQASNLDLPRIQTAEKEVAASNPPPVPGPTMPSLLVAAGQKRNFSDLLRTIDQGQESIQKSVDSYIADQHIKGTAKAQRGWRNNRFTAGAADPLPEALHSNRISFQAGANSDASVAHLQECISQIRPTGGHPFPAADMINAAARPNRRRQGTFLWIIGAMVVMIMAVAVPWASHKFGPGTTWHATIGSVPSADAMPEDSLVIALRDRLESARRDTLLEEAQILHVVGRLDESRIFLNRLLELYPGDEPAQRELDRITAEIPEPKKIR